jgi:hypothetical protein
MTRPWTIVAEADRHSDLEPAFRIAMEIDPRSQTVRLGVRPATGGGAELWYRAVYRHLFAEREADWTAVTAWLEGAAAQTLLGEVAKGYRYEMMWTGDVIGHWSDGASDALEALVEGVIARIAEETFTGG